MEVDGLSSNIIFYRGLTYDEWAAQQDHITFEFRAIDVCHKNNPELDLEEIKNAIYMNIIETEENQKIFRENFGQRHVNSEKLNQQMDKLCRAIFSTKSDLKSVDKRGHGDTITTRFGGRGKDSEVIAFRIEEKAIRYAHYLIEHRLLESQGAYTISDLVRMGFIKYLEMVPIINEIKDSVSDRFLVDMKIERESQEKLIVDKLLKGFEEGLQAKEEELMEASRHFNNKEELEEIRDWIVDFVKNALSYNCSTKREKARVKEFIMRNSRLYNIFATFEREKMLTKEYIDSVRLNGIALPQFSVVSQEDTRLDR